MADRTTSVLLWLGFLLLMLPVGCSLAFLQASLDAVIAGMIYASPCALLGLVLIVSATFPRYLVWLGMAIVLIAFAYFATALEGDGPLWGIFFANAAANLIFGLVAVYLGHQRTKRSESRD